MPHYRQITDGRDNSTAIDGKNPVFGSLLWATQNGWGVLEAIGDPANPSGYYYQMLEGLTLGNAQTREDFVREDSDNTNTSYRHGESEAIHRTEVLLPNSHSDYGGTAERGRFSIAVQDGTNGTDAEQAYTIRVAKLRGDDEEGEFAQSTYTLPATGGRFTDEIVHALAQAINNESSTTDSDLAGYWVSARDVENVFNGDDHLEIVWKDHGQVGDSDMFFANRGAATLTVDPNVPVGDSDHWTISGYEREVTGTEPATNPPLVVNHHHLVYLDRDASYILGN